MTLLQFEGSSARSSSSLVLKSRPSSDLDGSGQSPAHFRHTPASQRQRRFSDHGESLRPQSRCFLYISVKLDVLCLSGALYPTACVLHQALPWQQCRERQEGRAVFASRSSGPQEVSYRVRGERIQVLMQMLGLNRS